ncbi:LamG domain-containing protein [Candidatus Pacearchaeota archaeon]|nr:LamG domain-containing protein [Candidatus Pacearchaeota archaeon]
MRKKIGLLLVSVLFGIFLIGGVFAADINYALSGEGYAMVKVTQRSPGADGYVSGGDAAYITDGNFSSYSSQYSHDGGYAYIEVILNFSSPIPQINNFFYKVRGARTASNFQIKTQENSSWTTIKSDLTARTVIKNFTVDGPFYNVTEIRFYVRSNSDNDPYRDPYGVAIYEIEAWGPESATEPTVINTACPSGLVSYWSFDDGTANDQIGNNDGTIYGPNSAAGKVSNALNFDGVDDYVGVSDDNSLDMEGPFTMGAWINPIDIYNPINDRVTIIDKGHHGAAADTNYLMYLSPWSIACVIGNSTHSSSMSYLMDTTGSWNHVMCIYDGTSFKMYVNGVFANDSKGRIYDYDGGDPVSNAGPIVPKGNDKLLSIGDLHSFDSAGYPNTPIEQFDGSIDEVVIFNRALSLTEISELYQKGANGVGACAQTSTCNNNQRIMKLYSPSNSHGAKWDDTHQEYSVDICYNTIFGSDFVDSGTGYHPDSCTDPILWMTADYNSHASTTSHDTYTTPVCYGDLSCSIQDNACNAGEEMVLALYDTDNSHITDPNYRPSGLVSEWKFDGDVLDSVGGNDGTWNGGGSASYDDGQIGQGLEFDGGGDWVDIPNIDLASEYSYSIWLKTDADIQETYGINSVASVGNGVMNGYNTTSILSMGKNALAITGHWNNNVPLQLWYDFPILKDDWTNVVITSVNNVGSVYVDGDFIGTFNDPMDFNIGMIGTRSYQYDSNPPAYSYYYFDGLMDNFQIYDQALSSEEVQHLYNKEAYTKKVCCKSDTSVTTTGAYWADMTDKLINKTDLEDEVKVVIDQAAFQGQNINVTIYEDSDSFVRRILNILTFGFVSANPIVGTVSGAGYVTWVAGDKGEGTLKSGNYYFKAHPENDKSNVIDSRDYGPYGILTVTDTVDNEVPTAVIISPNESNKYIIKQATNKTNMIYFTQASYDEDDDLKIQWTLGESIKSQWFLNCQKGQSCNTIHVYNKSGVKYIELVAQEMKRSQSNKDQTNILVYKEGINIFVLMKEKKSLDDSRGVIIDTTDTHVANCTRSWANIAACSATNPQNMKSGSSCYQVTDSDNPSEMIVCYNIETGNPGGSKLKYFWSADGYDIEPAIVIGNAWKYYYLFDDPGDHKIKLKAAFLPS